MTYFTRRAAILLTMLAAFTFALQAQTTFYENDFADEFPSGWMSEDLTAQGGEWTWCGDPDQGVGDGCVVNWANYNNQHDGTFAATTSDNGFLVMDSDALGGLPLDHEVVLTSAPIDCSGQSEVWFSMEGLIGVFGLPATDNAVLKVSNNGVDFTTYNLYEVDIATRWSENPELTIVDISAEAAGESTVYIQWSWVGNYEYYWCIDDIKLWDSDPTTLLIPPNEMRVNENFYAIAPNARWPLSQTEQFGFLADIENVGSTDQTGVTLNVTITDEGGNTVYTEDNVYGTVEVDSLAENDLFDGGGYTPDALGVYTGLYTVSQDNPDDNPENNTQSFAFQMTDTVFSKGPGDYVTATRPADANWGPADGWSWAWGCEYYVINANDQYFRTVTFAVEEDEGDSGKPVFIKIYKWEDDNDDALVDPEERGDALGIAFYTTTGTEDRTTPITLPIYNLLGEPIALEDNTRYLAVLEYITDINGDELLFGTTTLNYAAQVFRSSELGEPRYSDVLGIAADLDTEPFSTGGFGNDVVPNIAVSIGDPLVSTSAEEVLDNEHLVNVFPNPASDYLTVDLDFTETMEYVNLYVVDATGKLIRNVQLENIRQQQVEVELDQLTSGTYFLQVVTDKGVRNQTFMVQK